MRFRIASGTFAAVLVATTLVAQAALTTGTLLNGTITQGYSSKTAHVGESVVLNNVTNDDGSGSVVRGKLYGYVSSVQKAGQGRPGKIAFRFTELVTTSGATYSVNSTVTKMKVDTKNNTLKEAGGALAGMLVGNMIGKTLFHLSGGGIVGAAGGFLLAKNNREDVSVPGGTIVQVELNSITRRQSH
ncbi:MAG: hypothetical protein KGN02_10675 [bacterium]|nr:hypothetical protein [bacterium]